MFSAHLVHILDNWGSFFEPKMHETISRFIFEYCGGVMVVVCLGISVNNIRQSAGAFRARRAKLLMIFFALLSSIEFDFYAEDCV